ncbi:MAG TPA: patatin-like phospholipase family protein [Gemmatimonadaceae bacterium]|nr:patatin-like phospholipase family protein [Gemmatimonadaceae bacterium]
MTRPPSRTRTRRPKIGLALAGGGPVGAMYELGALRALEEAVRGLDLNRAYSYVGVSAGSFIAACLANGLTTSQMLRAVLRDDPGVNPLRPDIFFTPAYAEIARRGFKLPRLVAESIADMIRRPGAQAVGSAVNYLMQALPVGVFDNEPIREYLEAIFALDGRTDDFRKLKRRLTVVAADLDSGRAIRFGDPGWDHIPISTAVQASTALPGVYTPVCVEGRQCVDGVLLKTVHASVALEQGADLLFCVNPIVPIDAAGAAEEGRLPEDVIVQAGLPAVLSQTFRTLIHSRLRVGFARYSSRFPDADVVLLEPDAEEYELFFANVFSFRSRRHICRSGYEATRRTLRRRFDELHPLLASHGLELRADMLDDGTRDVWTSVGLESGGLPAPSRESVTDRLSRALDRVEAAAAARTAAR